MGENVLYFDCSSGVSGDMILAGIIDVGVPLKALRAELEKLDIGGFRLVRSTGTRGGLRGTRIRVETPNDVGYRHWKDFDRILKKSRLGKSAKDRSRDLIRRIFEVEALVHGATPDTVHLHELGSLDTLVDIVGAVCGVTLLEVDRIESSSVNVGSGFVDTEHGRMSVPAPATTLLLKGVPVFSDGEFERTTPTGALLVSGLVSRFGPWPAFSLDRIGYGLGTKNPKVGRPNALRLVVGRVSGQLTETLLSLECTIDDATPEMIGFVQERLLGLGVLDVFLTPVMMKKNRPGTNVTVLIYPSQRDAALAVLFKEGSTLGVRSYEVQREALERRFVEVKTRYGTVRIKEGWRNGIVVNASPEYENCRRLAKKNSNVSLKSVQRAAMAAYEGQK